MQPARPRRLSSGRPAAHGVPTMSGYPAEPVLGKRKRSVAQRFDPAEPAQRGRRRSTEQAEQRKSAQVSRSRSALTAATATATATAASQQPRDPTCPAATNASWQPRRDRRKRKRAGPQDKAFDPSKRRRGSWLDTPTKAKILTRYSLCLERRQAGLPVKETAADIAREVEDTHAPNR